jgi:hypothetical protein
MIPLGDIDLQHDTGVVNSHRGGERAWVRRVCSARVDGRQSNVTVAIYQGDGAEEVRCVLLPNVASELASQKWKQDIENYMKVRQVPVQPFAIPHG